MNNTKQRLTALYCWETMLWWLDRHFISPLQIGWYKLFSSKIVKTIIWRTYQVLTIAAFIGSIFYGKIIYKFITDGGFSVIQVVINVYLFSLSLSLNYVFNRAAKNQRDSIRHCYYRRQTDVIINLISAILWNMPTILGGTVAFILFWVANNLLMSAPIISGLFFITASLLVMTYTLSIKEMEVFR